MNSDHAREPQAPLQLWGGLECTVNRVGDAYFNQIERNGHCVRADDIDRFASLGISAIRYPVLWERTAPNCLDTADWHLPDQRLAALRDTGIRPIVGLVHHGSGPPHTSLTDPAFATGLAQFAEAVATRYPWIEDFTPVNEPLTTARFSGLYGLWYPHGRDDHIFLQALLVQCKAVVLAMAAIRRITPTARLVQTDDLGKSYGTPEMAAVAGFYNQRRWLAWDLLCGMVDPQHALWPYLTSTGIAPEQWLWFSAHPCPPDVIGVNYYVTSERWLDHRPERYPPHFRGSAGHRPCADIDTSRALATPTAGIGPLLHECWERYKLPIAVTEAHIDANREDQLRWLLEVWQASKRTRDEGVDVRAVTAWALLGSFDWNSLVTRHMGYYEPGPFDVRSAPPRRTALAGMMSELAAGKAPSHPVLRGQGWWRRPGRLLCEPVSIPGLQAQREMGDHGARDHARPILITGATGTLGRAFARVCRQRHLAYRLLDRKELDIADEVSVHSALRHHRPWAVINASGYVRVDEAEADVARCYRENVQGPALLAKACARHGVHLTTFSSDLVFDGRTDRPYVEHDSVAPLNIYGHSKAAAEQIVLKQCQRALVIRTSAFFGPWDSYNFVIQAVDTLARGAPFTAVSDITVTPTYVPDLVHACLDLIIDQEQGIWHLTNGTPLTWAELAEHAARHAGVDASRLEPRQGRDFGYQAQRPEYSALGSERGLLLPPLDTAIARFMTMRAEPPELEQLTHGSGARHVGQQETLPAPLLM